MNFGLGVAAYWILVRAVLGMLYFELSGDVHQDISMSWGTGGHAHSALAHPLVPPPPLSLSLSLFLSHIN